MFFVFLQEGKHIETFTIVVDLKNLNFYKHFSYIEEFKEVE